MTSESHELRSQYPHPGVSVSHHRRDGHEVIEVTGEIDIATVDQFRAAISELIEAGHSELVIDLSAVDFIGSEGLLALSDEYDHVHEYASSFRVFAPQPHIRRLFSITKLDSKLRVFGSFDELQLGPEGGET